MRNLIARCLLLLIAFTFSGAASRFDQRRHLIIEEANAIGTTYLRAGYLPDPASSEIRELLREYVPLRINVADRDQFAANFAENGDRAHRVTSRALRGTPRRDPAWDRGARRT